MAAWLAVLLPLAVSGCASGRSEAPARRASTSPDRSAQISPAHPYCMFVPTAGELRECYQFAFGGCTAYGPRCPTPGPMASRSTAERGTGAAAGADGSPR